MVMKWVHSRQRRAAMVAVLGALVVLSTALPAPALSWNPMDWVGGDSVSQANRKAAEKADENYEAARREAREARAAANAAREQATRLEESARLAEARASAAKRVVAAYQQQTAAAPAAVTTPAPAADAPEDTAAAGEDTDTDTALAPISHYDAPAVADDDTAENPVDNDTQTTLKSAAAPAEEARKRSWMPQTWNPMAWLGLSDDEAKQQTEYPEKVAYAKPARKSSVSETLDDAGDDSRALPAMPYTGAVIETQKGNIVVEFYKDQAPETVRNFMALASTGFYNNINMKFHRVIPGFVVQTGDPTGTGAGGSGKRIPLEVDNKLSHDAKGMVAMARGPDPNSATSQFYITLAPQKTLDGKYAVFAHVISGLDVLEKIEKDDRVYGVKLIDAATVARDVDPNDKKFLKWF
ncbi:MAG: peptidylprolyl isomerase [Candidatus Melainabacteria bacterium]